MERALKRAGHETLLLDDRKTKRLAGFRITQAWIKSRSARFRPGFVFLSKCLALSPETVAGIIAGKPNAMWYHDPQWYRDVHRPDIAHIVSIGKLANTFFVTGFTNEWRQHGLRAKFLPAAGDSGIGPVAHDPAFASDVAFIGTGYDEDRAALLAEVGKHFRLKVWGLGWEQRKGKIPWGGRPVEGREFAAVCSSSKITLGANPARAAGATNYTSDRTWMTLLAGAFLLAPSTPGMDSMLRGGEHCGWYTDTESCIRQIQYYLAREPERNRIRVAGEKFARNFHTYDQRIGNLLSGLEFANPV